VVVVIKVIKFCAATQLKLIRWRLLMIETLKDYKATTLTASTPKSVIRFNPISDEDKTAHQRERRFAPTRRRADQPEEPIERRTSSDRRRHSFSSKA